MQGANFDLVSEHSLRLPAEAGSLMSIVRPLLGRLNQGCIFTCASAENYVGCRVHGFVITARCDIEQDKFPVLNYLPIVNLDDWLERDGFDILHSRLVAETEGALDGLLKEFDIPKSLLNSQSLEQIKEAFFPEPFTDKASRTKSERLTKTIAKLSELQAAHDAQIASPSSLFGINERASGQLIRELIHNKLSGHYFLPTIDDSRNNDGYVILLREVKHLPRQIVQKIADGLDATEAKALQHAQALCFEIDDFAMPIGELASPNIEHVLQVFSSLFGRIGLKDHPQSFIDHLCQRRPIERQRRA